MLKKFCCGFFVKTNGFSVKRLVFTEYFSKLNVCTYWHDDEGFLGTNFGAFSRKKQGNLHHGRCSRQFLISSFLRFLEYKHAYFYPTFLDVLMSLTNRFLTFLLTFLWLCGTTSHRGWGYIPHVSRGSSRAWKFNFTFRSLGFVQKRSGWRHNIRKFWDFFIIFTLFLARSLWGVQHFKAFDMVSLVFYSSNDTTWF